MRDTMTCMKELLSVTSMVYFGGCLPVTRSALSFYILPTFFIVWIVNLNSQLFYSLQFVGNLISLALLRDATVCLCLCLCFFFCILPLDSASLCLLYSILISNCLYLMLISIISLSLQEGSTSGTTLLYVVFLCSMTLGTLLMCFLQKRDGKQDDGPDSSSTTLYHSLISSCNLVITPLLNVRMLLVIPLIAYSGLQQAFVW